jgi:hypothetical protein
VAAFVDLVEVDQVVIGALCPTPRGLIVLARKDAHGSRDGDVDGVVKVERNYSGIFLVPPATAGEEKGKEARTPRAPATRSDCARHAGGTSTMTASPGTPCWGVTKKSVFFLHLTYA